MRAWLGASLAALIGVIAAQGCSRACDSDCASGDMCVYAIGVCPGHGECQTPPSVGPCGFETVLCGCSGLTVLTGCSYPVGYASGPTNGAPSGGDYEGVACTSEYGPRPMVDAGLSLSPPYGSGDAQADASPDAARE